MAQGKSRTCPPIPRPLPSWERAYRSGRCRSRQTRPRVQTPDVLTDAWAERGGRAVTGGDSRSSEEGVPGVPEHQAPRAAALWPHRLGLSPCSPVAWHAACTLPLAHLPRTVHLLRCTVGKNRCERIPGRRSLYGTTATHIL